MKRWFMPAVMIAAVLMIVAAPSVRAGGNGAQTFTQTFKDQTDLAFVDVVPCVNIPASITLTYNGVFHITINKAGDVWVTGTMTGTVVAIPLDPSQPTFTGHFTTWFGEADNAQNGVQHSTFTVHAVGTDGTRIDFHDTSHLSTNASGNGLVVSFDKPSC